VTIDIGNPNAQNTIGAGIDGIDGSTFEMFLGSAKNDHLTGYNGLIRIDGGGGNDTIVSNNTQELFGGAGNDLLVVGGLKHVIDGGVGIDTASYTFMGLGVTVDLNVQGEQNVGLTGTHTLTGIENLIGSANDDTFVGDGNINRLEGGMGSDTLTGGLGNDTFIYNAAAEGGDDITDFGAGIDKIQISKAGFGIANSVAVGGSGQNSFNNEYFVANATGQATKGGHGQFVYDTSSSTLYWDADGTGAGAAVEIAAFGNNYVLKATDFTLV
jgi:serralysin